MHDIWYINTVFRCVQSSTHLCVCICEKEDPRSKSGLVKAGQTNMCLYLCLYLYLYLLKMEKEEQARLGQSWSDPPGICGLGHFLALECSITWTLRENKAGIDFKKSFCQSYCLFLWLQEEHHFQTSSNGQYYQLFGAWLLSMFIMLGFIGEANQVEGFFGHIVKWWGTEMQKETSLRDAAHFGISEIQR